VAQFELNETKRRRLKRSATSGDGRYDMSEFKIKQGYSCVIDDEGESYASASAPSIYNVPNPASEVDTKVTREELVSAITTHCQTGIAQIERLGIHFQQKIG
jgi:hypothetical protein